MLADSDDNEAEVETCAQLFLRLTSKPSLEFVDLHLFPSNFPKPGEVVEIHGSSATAKTELLVNLISKCILPKSWNGILINGIESEVLFIDTDFKFSVIRLQHILKQQLMKCFSNASAIQTESKNTETNEIDLNDPTASGVKDEHSKCKVNEHELEELVKSSLDRLYLVKCSSTDQLLITLHSVESIFSQHPQMTVLMLDNMSTFYWEDRVKTGDNWTKFGQLQDKVLSLLQKLIQEYHLVMFLTKNSTTLQNFKGGRAPLSSNADLEQTENFTSKSWCKISTHRFILTRTDFPFPVVVDGKEKYASYCVKVGNKEGQHQCQFYISSDGISYT